MAGSSIPMRRLGAELRRLREAAGRTQVQVGKAVGRSHATLVNWEHGKTRIGKADLAYLLAELRAPTETRKSLERLRGEIGRGRGEWAAYGMPESLRPFLSFEEDAVTEATFEPVVVPGLLQTEEYARETHRAVFQVVPPAAVDALAAGRVHRQQRLTGRDPITVDAVVTEAALRLPVGGPAVMAAQLEHLLVATKEDNVSLRVIPASAWAYAGVASNVIVLHFADPEVDPPLAYYDGPLGGYLVNDFGDVAAMAMMVTDLRESALDAADSTELISAILDGFRMKE